MNWARAAFGLSDILSIVLIVRLISLRLHHVYRVFCCFLLFQVLTTSVTFLERFTSLNQVVDYRITWLVMRVGLWTLSIWMVYALLQAILEKLPGILRASQRALNIALPLAIGIAVISAGPEYVASGAAKSSSAIDFLVSIAMVLERTISTVALLTLLLMLFFILWFPVKMPRNLALFSLGFIVYFSVKTSLLLLRSFWSHESFAIVDNGVTLILCLCLLYWITFLNTDGEATPMVLGHSWRTGRQNKLIGDLEALNTSLARAARR